MQAENVQKKAPGVNGLRNTENTKERFGKDPLHPTHWLPH